MEPRVSIVVVAARSPERLKRCLDAVARCAPPTLEIEVILVLNAAEPGMREAARGAPAVRILNSDVSLGFAGGVNLAARHARGELIHLLHDDAEVEPGWLESLVAVLDERPEVGAAGSLVTFPDGTVQAAGHVLWREGRTDPRWPVDAPPDPASFGDVAYPADYCAGASLLVRRAAWEAVGGLEEEFHPAYFVDVDLAMSLRSKGYVVVCEPKSRVRHERAGSTRVAFRIFISERNRRRFIVKWAHDLEYQEPYADDPQALSRAAAATRRRALQVASATRPDPSPGGPRPPIDETEVERLRREHRHLLRDLAVKSAYIEEFEELRARVEADGEAARLAIAEHERLRVQLVDAQHQIAVLAERVRTLDAIEAGGWWRLRRRLLPLVRVGGRLQRLTRRAGSSRTG
jgi:GT2 family glycosyltransferase